MLNTYPETLQHEYAETRGAIFPLGLEPVLKIEKE
jgi:hypothetical protein